MSSKKELILDYQRAHGLERAGLTEIRQIQAELARRLGADRPPSRSYIASVLRAAGVEVDYEDRFAAPAIEEPYAARLRHVIQFRDLAAAEDSIRKLDALYRAYEAAQDRQGVKLVRLLALKGKSRAGSLAANPRVNEGKRREKREIANWFRVWLESPDLFADWIELRKKAEEFQAEFGASSPLRRVGKSP